MDDRDCDKVELEADTCKASMIHCKSPTNRTSRGDPRLASQLEYNDSLIIVSCSFITLSPLHDEVPRHIIQTKRFIVRVKELMNSKDRRISSGIIISTGEVFSQLFENCVI